MQLAAIRRATRGTFHRGSPVLPQVREGAGQLSPGSCQSGAGTERRFCASDAIVNEGQRSSTTVVHMLTYNRRLLVIGCTVVEVVCNPHMLLDHGGQNGSEAECGLSGLSITCLGPTALLLPPSLKVKSRTRFPGFHTLGTHSGDPPPLLHSWRHCFCRSGIACTEVTSVPSSQIRAHSPNRATLNSNASLSASFHAEYCIDGVRCRPALRYLPSLTQSMAGASMIRGTSTRHRSIV